MVQEIARFRAQPGKADDLARGLTAALAVIRGSDGCTGVTLSRCVEEPDVFVYQITWRNLEDHTVTFRGGPRFAEYRAHIAGLFVDPVVAQHFEPVEQA